MENISNFIHDIIDRDLAEGFARRIHTRFPPEPNGYLHIGSAKAIWINWITARKYGGTFNLRYDDTNPVKEDDEYIRAIESDLRWLGAVPDGGIFFGSDYFDKCYEFALGLIRDGHAYVCDLTSEQMREYRGTLTQPGRESPYRNRTAEENLDLFQRMKNGEFEDGSRTLRAKIDMTSSNMNMRDPAIYRILRSTHHRQGDKWCIYPLYDYAHPIQDALEGITHSLCSIEFENHRPLYDWVIEKIGFEAPPRQYEFARLNVSYTVLSKRYLRYLVESGLVDGWDDPRMPTLSGLRRRGYTPSSIFEFVRMAGVSKTYSLVDVGMLEFCIRDELNKTAQRRIAVTDPIKVTITNYPEDQVEQITIPNNPEDENAGSRDVPICREIYIERSDFMADPPAKFHRLSVGREVRLVGTYFIKCNEAITDQNGEIVELMCTYDPDTRSGHAPDGRKVKGTIHWVSARHAIDAKLRLYDRLFTIDNLNDMPEGTNFDDFLNKDSLTELTGCKLEPSLANASPDERFQFVRTGYFYLDSKDKQSFNRIVPLKDSWAKISK